MQVHQGVCHPNLVNKFRSSSFAHVRQTKKKNFAVKSVKRVKKEVDEAKEEGEELIEKVDEVKEEEKESNQRRSEEVEVESGRGEGRG